MKKTTCPGGLIAMIFVSGWVCRQPLSGQAPRSDLVAQKQPLALTYVANSGVLVGAGDAKVLIDALFDKPNPEYRAPASEVLDKMMKGAAPFDGVDLVLVTHNHPDHFNAALAVRYLQTRPEPVLLAPSDAVEAMRKAAADWTKLGRRVVALDIKVGEQTKRDIAGIPVTAFRTLHSGDRESPMNLMFLFELGGRRVFHEGDSNGNPRSIKVSDRAPLRSTWPWSITGFRWIPIAPDGSRRSSNRAISP